jgi:hypothetical protein
MLAFEEIINKIMMGSGLCHDEIMTKIYEVQREFYGFVTDAGAASLLAYRMNISLDDTQDLGKIGDEASPSGQETGLRSTAHPDSCSTVFPDSRSTDFEKNKTGGSGMGLKYKVEAPKQVADGLHEGTIVRLEESPREKRGRKFVYLDVYVLEKKEGVELRAGYPANITPVSALGKLCQRFGSGLDIGKEIEVEAILLNKPCTFVTVNEETKSGTFARVQRDSLKPMP